MNKKTLSIRMKDNYSAILGKMSDTEKAWAEKFEAMEYELERGHPDRAVVIAEELKQETLTAKTTEELSEIGNAKRRCNPVLAEIDARAIAKARPRKTDRRSPDTMYDPSDFIDQRFNAAGYEQAVSLSPEDAIVDAIDAARAANTSLEDILLGNTTFTKPRGRGRPAKKGI